MHRERVAEAVLIDHIRDQLRHGGCRECVPTALGPIKPLAGSANWQVLEHPACSDPCQAKMLEACARLADRYDVDWPVQRGAVNDPTHTASRRT